MSAEVVARMDTNSTSSSSGSSANFSVGHHAESSKSEHTKVVLPRHDGEASGNSESFISAQEHARKDNLKPTDVLRSSRESKELDEETKQSPVSVQAVEASKGGISAISPLTATADAHSYPHPPASAAIAALNESCAVTNPVMQQNPSLASLGAAASHATVTERLCTEQENALPSQHQDALCQPKKPIVTVPAQQLDSSTSGLPEAEARMSEALQVSPPGSPYVGAQKGPLVPITSSLPRTGSITGNSSTKAPKISSTSPIVVLPSRPSAALKPSAKQVTRPRSNSVPTTPSGCGTIASTPTHTPSSSDQVFLTATNTKPNPQSKQASALRRGKWTVEEEAYVARVIQDFNSGFLNAPAGTTLRTYLSEKLHCDPMRITKKFTGDACIGKRVFHPAVRCANNSAAIDKAQTELDALERRWRRRLEMQQRESAKRAAASAAAAAAAASGRHHLHVQGSHHSTGTTLYGQLPPAAASSQQLKQSVVTQTASWLDRANAILSTESSSSQDLVGQAESQVPPAEVENQMKDIQLLIHEGPMIQQTSAGLPRLLDKSSKPAHETTGVAVSPSTASTAISSYSVVGADSKRKVTDDDNVAVSSVIHPTSSIVSSSSNPPSTQVPQHSGTLLTQHINPHYSHQQEVMARSASTPDQSLATANSTRKSNSTENIQWPQDKRPRRSLSAIELPSVTTTDKQVTSSAPPSSMPGSSPTIKAAEEEAEALVAFLHSVRASAAASDLSSRPSS